MKEKEKGLTKESVQVESLALQKLLQRGDRIHDCGQSKT